MQRLCWAQSVGILDDEACTVTSFQCWSSHWAQHYTVCTQTLAARISAIVFATNAMTSTLRVNSSFSNKNIKHILVTEKFKPAYLNCYKWHNYDTVQLSICVDGIWSYKLYNWYVEIKCICKSHLDWFVSGEFTARSLVIRTRTMLHRNMKFVWKTIFI